MIGELIMKGTKGGNVKREEKRKASGLIGDFIMKEVERKREVRRLEAERIRREEIAAEEKRVNIERTKVLVKKMIADKNENNKDKVHKENKAEIELKKQQEQEAQEKLDGQKRFAAALEMFGGKPGGKFEPRNTSMRYNRRYW